MDILKEYEKDLKSVCEIEEMLNLNFEDDITVNQVYLFINKLSLINYYITIYDKYYNFLSNINEVENHQFKNVISLYDKYKDLYFKFIEKVCNKFCITDFEDEKYMPFLMKMFQDAEHLPTDKVLYSELYKNSEEIYKVTKTNDLTKEEKIELAIKYAEIKDKMAKLCGYHSFLEQRLSEIGIKYETFINLLNCDLKKIEIKDYEHLNDNYKKIEDLEEMKEKFVKSSSDYIDKDIIENFTVNLKSSFRGVTSVAYKKPPIILVEWKNKLENMSVWFHEVAHAYHYVVASNDDLINYNPNQFISELFAMTIQTVVLDCINDDENYYLRMSDYNFLLVDAIYALKIVHYIYNNYKNLDIDDLNKHYSDFENYINFVFGDYYDLNYSFGFIGAIVLANKIKNKEIGKNEINAMLMSSIDLNANQILKKVNIDLDNLNVASIFENYDKESKLKDKKLITK